MSKTLNQLNKYTKALQKQEKPLRSEHSARVQITWLIGGAFFIMVVLILVFNFRLLLMVKNYASTKTDYSQELNRFGEALNQNHQELRNRLDAIESVIKDNIRKLSQLEKTVDADHFAVENLTKAKDTLYKRVTELETRGAAPLSPP